MNIKEKIVQHLRKRITDPDYSFEVGKNDVFLISYPKSGNTWVRFLLSGLMTKEENIQNYDIEENVPDIYKKPKKNKEKRGGLKIYKTHSYYRPKFNSNKVIYLVRDPRDVVLSFYNFHKKRAKKGIDFNSFFNLFVDCGIDSYGNWGGHVGGWLGGRLNDPNFLLVKYEDLLEDTYKEFSKIVDFLNFNGEISDSRINEIIKNCEFNNLKKNEKKILNPSKKIKKRVKNKDYFFNSGKRNQWRKVLTRKQVKIIEKKFGSTIRQLGYF